MAKQVKRRPAIGIDLGTSYSCVGIWRNDLVEIIINEQGNRTTPSWVAFNADDQFVGDAAKNQAHKNPHNTIFGAKRLIGRSYNAVNRGLLPYKVEVDDEGNPRIVVEYKGEWREFLPEEISALVLAYMKSIAETFLETPVEDAVITVPAYFDDSQRRATKEAGRIAGLNVMRLMNEPIAAAVAYHLDKARDLSDGESKNVLVFDLGGGTLDVSVVEMQGDILKVKTTAGDTWLGGEDFDENMVRFAAEEFKRKHKADISSNPAALSRLRAACERAKRNLSFATVTDVEVESLYEGIDFSCKFTRAKFEEVNKDLFDRCIDIVNRCLDDAKMDKSEIDKLVLVGGSSRIPKVQHMLREMFGGAMLCKSINPDEAIAYGAAVEAAKLAGESNSMVSNLVLQGVTPLSLGIRTNGELMDVVIPRNTLFPIKKSENYVNMYDNQTSMVIYVYEGERGMVADNKLLGEFKIQGLPPAPADKTKVTVCFEIDDDGILHVWAEHEESGVREEITVQKRMNELHDEDDIHRRVNEAEEHKMEDEKRREKAKAMYELDSLVTNMGTRIKANNVDVKMTTGGRRKLEKEIEEAGDWLKRNPDEEASEYKDRTRKLQQSWESASERNPDAEASEYRDRTRKLQQNWESTSDMAKNKPGAEQGSCKCIVS